VSGPRDQPPTTEARRGPILTPSAVEHLDGRPLVLRVERRNGCCGGHTVVPVADIGPPAEPERYTAVPTDDEVVCYLDPLLLDVAAAARVDVVGIGRWRRLYLEGIDLAQDGHTP
jgi:hypothetical protein